VRFDFGKVFRREEYGQAVGRIVQVKSGAARDDELNNIVQNPATVRQIREESGSVWIVWAELTPADTPTTFAWTSGRGPNGTVESQTEVTASIEVGRKRPISLVIPFLKKTLGVS
jgi:HlyD family secretion protein